MFLPVSSIISCKRTETDTRELEAEAKEQKAKAEKQLQLKKSIDDMVAKHNAVTDWIIGSSSYTIHVQDMLVRKDDRPVLIFSPVQDVVRDLEKHAIYFGFDKLSISKRLMIEATLLDPFEDLYLYAVIARITEVEKVKFELRSHSEEVDVELTSSNIFRAKGICLDLLPVGNYRPWDTTQSQLELDRFRIHFVLECTTEQVERIIFPRDSDYEL